MKPFLEVIKDDSLHPSFHLLEVTLTHQPANWHYHPDIELTYVIEGEGIRLVGDYLGNFKAGDLMITGENLPHDFNLHANGKPALFLVIQFKSSLISQFPEFSPIIKMLEKARQGILFSQQNLKTETLLREFSKLPPPEQIIRLLDLLFRLSQRSDYVTLCSEIFSKNRVGDSQLTRLNQVIDFVNTHYVRSIELKEVAELTCMTEQSFCRWFKRTMDCSFVNYLNKCRVEQAGRHLATSETKISIIASDCGFESLSSFNRAFKKYKGVPPMHYRKLWAE